MDPTLVKWRIEAADKLWRAVLEIKEASSGPVFVLQILDPGEYQRILTHDNLRACVQDGREARGSRILSSTVNEVRPFIGEELYSLVIRYRGFLGRACHLLETGVDEGHIPIWYEDDLLREHLRAAMSPDEFSQFENVSSIDRFAWASDLLEAKIVGRIQKILPT